VNGGDLPIYAGNNIYLKTISEIGEGTYTINVRRENFTSLSNAVINFTTGNEANEVKRLDFIYEVPAQQAAHKPQMMLTAGASDDAESATLGRQRILRAGNLTQAEQVIEENEEISTLQDALLFLPMVRMLGNAPLWSMSIDISASDPNWTESIDLPIYDESGNRYYYWAEETQINGKTAAGYEVSYLFADADGSTTYCINAESAGEGLITVLNTKTEAVLLPESGGKGTRGFFLAGAAIMLLSCAGYLTIKRRRWYSE
jgi:LPXTG-motif cell wall-anchored protein